MSSMISPAQIKSSNMSLSRRPNYIRRAKFRLSLFKKATLLAVSTTGFLVAIGEGRADQIGEESDSVREATTIIQDLVASAYRFAPKALIAVLVVASFWLINLLIRRLLIRTAKGRNIAPVIQIGIYVLAFVIAFSILAGDSRALLGSLGLIGLALSWSLQTPIESFTAWVLNTFRSYYRVGDRIRVGEVFGDVYQIDYLTTTVWEAGGVGKSVKGAQPTGALITFPNNEILRSNIINYTRDFPYVWDEVSFGVSNESNLSYAVNVIRGVADAVLGEQMAGSIEAYRGLLSSHGLSFDVEDRPQVYLSLAESWTDCTVRYLVGARSRRRWSSLLIEKVSAEISLPKHSASIISAYPHQVIKISSDERPMGVST